MKSIVAVSCVAALLLVASLAAAQPTCSITGLQAGEIEFSEPDSLTYSLGVNV